MLTVAVPSNPSEPPPNQRRSQEALENNSRGEQGRVKYFGSDIKNKSTLTFRLAVTNVGTLPDTKDDEKHRAFVAHIRKIKADVQGINEVGRNWSKTPTAHQWGERMKGEFELLKTTLAWNKHDIEGRSFQYGGNALLTVGNMVTTVFETGVDPTNLGRWCWSRYRGKDGAVLRVVTAYCPVQDKGGEGSVAEQHKRYFHSQGISEAPRKAFRDDLKMEIEEWIDMGDQIAVMGDFNDDINSQSPTTRLFESLDMKEIVLSYHTGATPPSTQIRNTQGRVIDAIWTTSGLACVKAGYTDYGDFDHRTIWADFFFEDVFGHRSLPTAKFAGRRLKLGLAQVKKKYQDDYRVSRRKYKLLERARTLRENIYTNPTAENFAELESIDSKRTSCMISAEGRCRKVRMGKVDYSAYGNTLGAKYAFWKLAIRKRMGHRVSARRLSRLQKKAKLNGSEWKHCPIEALGKERARAKTLYDAFKPDAKKYRKAFIHSQCEAYVEIHGGDITKKLHEMESREEQRRQAASIKQALGKARGGGLSMVIEKVEGEQVEHFIEKDIVEVCTKGNKEKYLQSYNTPMLAFPLIREMGFLGFTTAAAQVLDGTYTPPDGLSGPTKEYLKLLKRPSSIKKDSCSETISIEEHISSLRRVKETTSSSPSGLHYGMWKANTEDPEAAELDSIMREIPYRTGYSLNRWKKAIDVELLKEEGNFDFDRLRTICLLEADYNLNCKKTGRDVMRMAQRSNDILADAAEQYGSKKAHRAQEVLVNTRLVDDILRQTRRAGAICSNDAKSCYDRIVHSVISICLQRLGLGKNPIQSMLLTIEEMTHHIRTAFGDSEESYQGSKMYPLQGIVQGHGCGPTGWAAVSTPLINAMREQGYGFQHWSAISREAVFIACFAFVDDTDLVHTSRLHATGEEIVQQMQSVLDMWEGGLKTTGGALVPKKSHWWLIDFRCGPTGRWVYRKQTETPGDLLLPSLEVEGETKVMERLEVTTAKEALGCWLRRDGSDTANVKAFREKTKKWGDFVRTGKLRREDAWQALKSTITKGVEYPLVATCFTKEESAHIMAPALAAGLNASAVQKNFPRDALYGPLAAQGMDLHFIHTTQLLEHILHCLRHAHRPTLSGGLLRSSMDDIILEVGSSLPLWELDYDTWSPLVTDCWLKHTWFDLTEAHMTLRDTVTRPQTMRHNDMFLTDAFVYAGYRGEELYRLNWYRRYLKVLRVSDIVNAEGTEVVQNIWDGKPREDVVILDGSWPRNKRPPAAILIRWRDALRKTLLRFTGKTLRTPLGHWKQQRDENWQWYYSPEEIRVYQRSTNGWKVWSKMPSRSTRRDHFCFSHSTTDIARDATRASGYRIGNRLVLDSQSILIPDNPDETMNSVPFPLFLQGIDSQKAWSTQDCEMEGTEEQLADALRTDNLIFVCDGSFLEEKMIGTAAYRLEDRRNENISLEGTLRAPGRAKDMESQRAELAGIYGGVTVIEELALRNHIDTGLVEVGCDNKGALRVFDLEYRFDPTQSDFDLLQSLQRRLAQSPLKWIGRHVKGHQDDDGNDEPLDHWALLNIRMDIMAKNRLAIECGNTESNSYNGVLFSEGWSLWSQGQKWAQVTKKSLHHDIQFPLAIEFWVDNGRFGEDVIDRIDWSVVETAMKKLPYGKRRWVTKQASNQCGVGVTMVKWKKQVDPDCPRCGMRETAEHVSKCRSPSSDGQWVTSLTSLQKWMELRQTEPSMQRAILLRLDQWRNDIPFTTPVASWPGVNEAVLSQDVIGWEHFIMGLISPKWKEVQQTYYKWLDKRNTGRRWSILMITKLFQVSWDMWSDRNTIRHAPNNARHVKAVTALDKVIEEEMISGVGLLPESMWHFFDVPLAKLFARPVGLKKQWVASVEAARKYAKALYDGTEIDKTTYCEERHSLRKWLSTGYY